jgi:ribA/ribD-fused uncharacterized protein
MTPSHRNSGPDRDIRDLESLRRAIQQGFETRFLFFWSSKRKGDILGPECLSQWYPARFTVGGTTYPTAEHYMMTEKARLFGDLRMRSRILDAQTPRAAKSLGRKVQNFDEATWQRERLGIVVRGNTCKFRQNERLRRFLICTGERVLVEASPYDEIWGIGMAETDARATDPSRWQGQNLLGFALMQVRSLLRNRR